MNTLQSGYKITSIQPDDVSSPLYLVKLKIAQKQPNAYCNSLHSFEQIVPDFRRKSFNIPYFLVCWKILYILIRFYQKIIFKLNLDNVNM